jgi:alkyl hydroperoxide reductase subunit D
MFGNTTTTDNALALLTELGMPEMAPSPALDMLSRTDSRYLKDLKINLANVCNTETLSKKESYLLALSVAVNESKALLTEAFRIKAVAEGASEKEIAEIISCTSLLNANNVYYRFRHFMQEEFYSTAPAGIRMSIMANPVLGKEFFELVSLCVSAVNGCEMCVTSHEKALIGQGTAKNRIHDTVRLAAVIKSLCIFF